MKSICSTILLAATLVACNTTLHTGRRGVDGGVGGSAGTSSGGASSGVGGILVGGSGGNAGSGGAMEPVDTRPARPAWTPPFTAPLGAPGWQQSTTPVCDANQGFDWAWDVWADERGVFAMVADGCNNLAGYPCGLDGATVKVNNGTGWQLVHQFTTGTIESPNLWGGFPGGPLLLGGRFEDYGVGFVDSAGFRFERAVFSNNGAFIANKELAYVLDGSSLLAYAAGTWSTVGQSDSVLLAVWADSQTVYVAGDNQTILRKSGDGPLTPLAGVPAGTYTAVWAFTANDVWFGNTAAQLVHYDGAKWEVHNTGSRDITGSGIRQLWGADATLYFTTYAEFGRLEGTDKLALLLEPPAGADLSAYPGQLGRFWGRSAKEVFLPLRDTRFRKYACGDVFMLWFDGIQFHQF